MNVKNDMDPDFEEKCDTFRRAMQGLSDLVDNQTRGLSLPSETIGGLLRVMAALAEEVVPQEHRVERSKPSND